eukprot:scaffold390723_cov20-Prasinocladus_malaysianus.AAC.1
MASALSSFVRLCQIFGNTVQTEACAIRYPTVCTSGDAEDATTQTVSSLTSSSQEQMISKQGRKLNICIGNRCT